MEENRHGTIAEALKVWAQGGTRANGATTNKPTNGQLQVSRGMQP